MTGGALEFATEKYGGHPHYRGAVHLLGDDEHGSWLWRPAGHTVFRGVEARFVTNEPALIVVAPDAWWSPSWYPGHAKVDLYVNIDTPAVWDDERIVCVDLDLDVIRFTDGRVEIVDQDEFDENQVRYGYPADLIAAAEHAAAAAFDLVQRNVAPFDGVAARHWMERGFALAG
jgi:protein associated with RNAse G/E